MKNNAVARELSKATQERGRSITAVAGLINSGCAAALFVKGVCGGGAE